MANQFNSAFMSGPAKFGDPFMLPSVATFPRDIKSTLDLCLYLYGKNRLYGAVANRVVSYFLTEVEFVGEADKKERDALREVLVDMLGVFAKMQTAGIDWAIYGNAFIRCVEPFDRWLVDERDATPKTIALSAYPEHLVEYNYEKMTYKVPDLRKLKPGGKGKKGSKMEGLPKVNLKFVDLPVPAPDRFSVVSLDPRYINLDKPHHSDDIQYIYSVPPDMENRIKTNVLHEINNTPRLLLEAVAYGKDVRFRRGEVYHLRAPSPTGLSDSGWACPEILLNYDALLQLQVYKKADAAIARDYMMPLRVMTPGAAGADGNNSLLMHQWRAEMKRMIAAFRQDPSSIYALPFAAQYAAYSGEGRQMSMFELVNAYTESFFDGLGFPRELYRGSMVVDQVPNAIRMFERSYEWLYQALNGLLQFLGTTVQRAMDSDEIKIRLKRPAMAYNAEWMQIRMQMAANREIPRADVYPDVGIADAEGSALRAVQEDQEIQRGSKELATKFEREMSQGSMADMAMAAAEQGANQGAPPEGGGAPAGGGAPDFSVDPNADPSALDARAAQIAQDWLSMHGQQPNSHRKQMQQCEATNPTLYAVAKQKMEQTRSQGAAQGRASVGQQPQ